MYPPEDTLSLPIPGEFVCDSDEGEDLNNPAAAVVPLAVMEAAERADPIKTLEALCKRILPPPA